MEFRIRSLKNSKSNELPQSLGCLWGLLQVFESIGKCKTRRQNGSSKNIAKVYFQRLSIIWSSPMSDYHRVAASNQFLTNSNEFHVDSDTVTQTCRLTAVGLRSA